MILPEFVVGLLHSCGFHTIEKAGIACYESFSTNEVSQSTSTSQLSSDLLPQYNSNKRFFQELKQNPESLQGQRYNDCSIIIFSYDFLLLFIFFSASLQIRRRIEKDMHQLASLPITVNSFGQKYGT